MSPTTRIAMAGSALALMTVAAAPAAPLRIDNPAQAPRSRSVTLAESWRVGGDDDDVILGQIGVAGVDAQGNVYALDTQLAHVLVFSGEGEFLRTLGREGEGPGEMRRPLHLDVRPDGGVAVVQPFPGKIINLKPDGTPAGEVVLGGSDHGQGGLALILGARERGGNLVVSASRNNFGGASGEIDEVRYLASLDGKGTELKRHAEIAAKRNLERMVFDEKAESFAGDRGRWDVGPDGRLYLAPRFDAYEIEVRAPDGTVERIITRPHDARRRTKEDLAEMHGNRRMNINGREPEIVETFAETDPSLAAFTVLDDGTLWVENSHARDRWAQTGEVRYDVYGPDGKLREEVAVTVPGGGEGHRLILLRDGRFLLVRGQESLSISISAGSGGGNSTSEAPGTEAADPLELVVYAKPR